jgi:hypothetical protein
MLVDACTHLRGSIIVGIHRPPAPTSPTKPSFVGDVAFFASALSLPPKSAYNLVDVNLHLRLVAVDRQGKEHEPSYYADSDAGTSHSFVNHMGREHPANYSSGDGGEVFKMLETEFSLPPDQIQECRVQSRPFERGEIKDIALHPRRTGK